MKASHFLAIASFFVSIGKASGAEICDVKVISRRIGMRRSWKNVKTTTEDTEDTEKATRE